MKNIHVLPTDKPSRFFKDDLGYYFSFETLQRSNFINQHIYITSDEEIKEGDYFWKPDCNMIFRAEYTPHKGCQKIILTTDQDLIKDGVQDIDDEFLEWFVKNPNCEYIQTTELSLFNGDTGQSGHYKYEIIIPQIEPKFISGQSFLEKADKVTVIHNPKQEQKQHLIDLMRLDEDVVIAPACVGQSRLHEQDTVGKEFYESADKTITVYRQETIYEVAERLVREHPDFKLEGYTEYQNGRFNGIIEGIEWQQEQDKKMYSEEEVKLLIDFVKDCATNWDCDNDSHKYNTSCRMCDAQKVLEQFKKK